VHLGAGVVQVEDRAPVAEVGQAAGKIGEFEWTSIIM
jgi:hypothetical protein